MTQSRASSSGSSAGEHQALTPAPRKKINYKARLERLEPTKKREMTATEQELMDQFFMRMQAIYRNMWSSAFKSEGMLRQAQKEWLEVFIRGGLTAADVSDGITRCKATFEFPPTPKDFMAILPRRSKAHQLHSRAALPEPEEHKKARYERGKEQIKKLKNMIKQTKPEAPDHDSQ